MVPFHQDPSYVDESRWGAANIWVPLVDIDADNGPLWVVSGSHRFNRGRRAFNQSFVYAADQDALAELARPLLVRAGEAVVLAHSLFHFSPPNRSARPRPAIGAVLVERGAPLYYNIIDGADRDWIEIFEADPELFLAAPISTRPDRAATARVPVQVETFSIEAVRRGSFPDVPA
jgi:ectoine hydroxylase-related dioxygenase (phytanoyl-CoA dioxygenase family)